MNKLFESIDNLFDSNKIINETYGFDAMNFESKIPHNMRFKSWDIIDNSILYWVTQEDFSVEDLEKFVSALNGSDFKSVSVTVRDLSNYDYKEDYKSSIIKETKN